MTKEQFDEGMAALEEREAVSNVYAVIGSGEDDNIIIIRGMRDLYQDCGAGIIIAQGRRAYYLPYDTIISLTGER